MTGYIIDNMDDGLDPGESDSYYEVDQHAIDAIEKQRNRYDYDEGYQNGGGGIGGTHPNDSAYSDGNDAYLDIEDGNGGKGDNSRNDAIRNANQGYPRGRLNNGDDGDDVDYDDRGDDRYDRSYDSHDENGRSHHSQQPQQQYPQSLKRGQSPLRRGGISHARGSNPWREFPNFPRSNTTPRQESEIRGGNNSNAGGGRRSTPKTRTDPSMTMQDAQRRNANRAQGRGRGRGQGRERGQGRNPGPRHPSTFERERASQRQQAPVKWRGNDDNNNNNNSNNYRDNNNDDYMLLYDSTDPYREEGDIGDDDDGYDDYNYDENDDGYDISRSGDSRNNGNIRYDRRNGDGKVDGDYDNGDGSNDDGYNFGEYKEYDEHGDYANDNDGASARESRNINGTRSRGRSLSHSSLSSSSSSHRNPREASSQREQSQQQQRRRQEHNNARDKNHNENSHHRNGGRHGSSTTTLLSRSQTPSRTPMRHPQVSTPQHRARRGSTGSVGDSIAEFGAAVSAAAEASYNQRRGSSSSFVDSLQQLARERRSSMTAPQNDQYSPNKSGGGSGSKGHERRGSANSTSRNNNKSSSWESSDQTQSSTFRAPSSGKVPDDIMAIFKNSSSADETARRLVDLLPGSDGADTARHRRGSTSNVNGSHGHESRHKHRRRDSSGNDGGGDNGGSANKSTGKNSDDRKNRDNNGDDDGSHRHHHQHQHHHHGHDHDQRRGSTNSANGSGDREEESGKHRDRCRSRRAETRGQNTDDNGTGKDQESRNSSSLLSSDKSTAQFALVAPTGAAEVDSTGVSPATTAQASNATIPSQAPVREHSRQVLKDTRDEVLRLKAELFQHKIEANKWKQEATARMDKIEADATETLTMIERIALQLESQRHKIRKAKAVTEEFHARKREEDRAFITAQLTEMQVASEAAMNQHKLHCGWFYGDVVKDTVMIEHNPNDPPPDGHIPIQVRVGQRLKLTYPPVSMVDPNDNKLVWMWLRCETIDPLTAAIKPYYVKGATTDGRIYYVNNFSFFSSKDGGVTIDSSSSGSNTHNSNSSSGNRNHRRSSTNQSFASAEPRSSIQNAAFSFESGSYGRESSSSVLRKGAIERGSLQETLRETSRERRRSEPHRHIGAYYEEGDKSRHFRGVSDEEAVLDHDSLCHSTHRGKGTERRAVTTTTTTTSARRHSDWIPPIETLLSHDRYANHERSVSFGDGSDKSNNSAVAKKRENTGIRDDTQDRDRRHDHSLKTSERRLTGDFRGIHQDRDRGHTQYQQHHLHQRYPHNQDTNDGNNNDRPPQHNDRDNNRNHDRDNKDRQGHGSPNSSSSLSPSLQPTTAAATTTTQKEDRKRTGASSATAPGLSDLSHPIPYPHSSSATRGSSKRMTTHLVLNRVKPARQPRNDNASHKNEILQVTKLHPAAITNTDNTDVGVVTNDQSDDTRSGGDGRNDGSGGGNSSNNNAFPLGTANPFTQPNAENGGMLDPKEASSVISEAASSLSRQPLLPSQPLPTTTMQTQTTKSASSHLSAPLRVPNASVKPIQRINNSLERHSASAAVSFQSSPDKTGRVVNRITARRTLASTTLAMPNTGRATVSVQDTSQPTKASTMTPATTEMTTTAVLPHAPAAPVTSVVARTPTPTEAPDLNSVTSTTIVPARAPATVSAHGVVLANSQFPRAPSDLPYHPQPRSHSPPSRLLSSSSALSPSLFSRDRLAISNTSNQSQTALPGVGNYNGYNEDYDRNDNNGDDDGDDDDDSGGGGDDNEYEKSDNERKSKINDFDSKSGYIASNKHGGDTNVSGSGGGNENNAISTSDDEGGGDGNDSFYRDDSDNADIVSENDDVHAHTKSARNRNKGGDDDHGDSSNHVSINDSDYNDNDNDDIDANRDDH